MTGIRFLPTLAGLRLAVRSLRRQPVISLATLLALAAGIGMATTGFTLLDAVLHSRLPYPNGDRFVLLEPRTDPEARRTSLEAERFRAFAAHAPAFEHLGRFREAEPLLQLSGQESVPVRAAFLTPAAVGAFPHAPLLGRTLRAEDGAAGAAPVVLIRASLWRRLFDADPQIVGRVATISGVARTIVGVAPDEFRFPGSGELWLPLADTPAIGSPEPSTRAFGVLRPGVAPQVAAAQLDGISRQFEAEHPTAPRLRIGVTAFTEALSRGLDLISAILVAALVLVLLVISANVANLVLARAFARSSELAVRSALGASRARLVGQIFGEVLLLGGAAAALGLVASQLFLAWMTRTLTDMPFWVRFDASPRTMLFVVAATLLAAGVSGALPALRATRRDPAQALATTSRHTSAGAGRLGAWMIALQVALSVALLDGALVLARGVADYGRVSLPVPSAEVLTASVQAPGSSPAAIVSALAALPGVTAAGAADSLPGMSPAARRTALQRSPGEAEAPARPAPVVAAEPGFFATLGAAPVAGRLFVPGDLEAGAPLVAVVNEPFVRKFLGGGNALGRRLRFDDDGDSPETGPWREIVGVVPDLGLSAGDENLAAGLYVPLGPQEHYRVALRAYGDPRLAGAVREAVVRLDPDAQVREVFPLADVAREDRAVFAGIGSALAAVGGMALALSVLGTYALLSLAVTRRTREIGIRTALGASRPRILSAILAGTAPPLAAGVVAGAALGEALVAARGIFAFRLPADAGPWGPMAIGAALVAAALLAAWTPARRALAIAPAEALRAE